MKTRRHASPPAILLPALLCGLLGAAAMAGNAMANTSPRMMLTKAGPAGGGHQHHGHQASSTRGQQAQSQSRRRGGPKKLRLLNGEGASVVLWRPDLSIDPLMPTEDGVVEFKPKVDNYHAVVAERESGGVRRAAIRYEYLRGKPSPDSPSRLAAAYKTDLEIEPAPIPREHHRYMANKEWEFILRFQGKVLDGVPVVLETSHGSRVDVVTNEAGVARFTIPDDFTAVKAGRNNNPAAEFTVFSKYETGGMAYETVLSAPYFVDPGHWESRALGWAMASLGLLVGGFIGGIGLRTGGKGK